MKKLFYTFVLSVIILAGLNSCSDEAFDVDNVNKQTILVFLPWSGSDTNTGLTSYLSNNIDSICQGIIDRKGLDNSRVMVFFSKDANSSTLYDLQYDETTRKVNRVPVKNYEGTEYNSATGIADILNEVKSEAEALNYAMIIGGHGCGWTYVDDWTNYPVNAKPYRSKLMTRFFGSVSKHANSIDITTLAEGIKQSGLKMQYILFDACYMGNVETAYELKDVTNFLITSSSEILARGIPYRSLWNSLNSSTPGYSNIINGTVDYYKNIKLPWCNMAAIDCRQMDNLANMMKEINGKYQLSSAVPLDSIQPLDGFSNHLFFDMQVYVDSLCPVGYLKEQFANQLKKTVKVSAHTDSIVSSLYSSSGTFYKVKNYCGLSISDPSQNAVAIRGRGKSSWWNATH